MRHRRKGKKLGVNPSHRRALLANLAENLIIHKFEKEKIILEYEKKIS